MMNQPALSILIPWCDRDELATTLAANEPVFQASSAEVIVLNCAGDSRRLRELIAHSAVKGVRQLDIPAQSFNKSLALNVGIAHARADVVFTLDADVALLTPIPIGELHDKSFVTIEWVYESAVSANAPVVPGRDFLELSFRGGVRVRHQLGRRDKHGNMRAGPGLLVADKQDLLAIEGFNSDLDTWGWEDDDVLIRLQHKLGCARIQAGSALHLSHDDTKRNLNGSRIQSSQRNFIKCCRNYNRGIFVGTYSADVSVIGSVNVAECLTADLSEGNPLPAGLLPPFCGQNSPTSADTYTAPGQPSIEELLLEAALIKLPIAFGSVIQARASNTRLATRLALRCRQFTVVPVNESVRASFEALRLPNCAIHTALESCFSDRLYDLVVSASITKQACCQRHWVQQISRCFELLAPNGIVAAFANPATGFG